MGGTRMSDRKQNNVDDSEFDRELALTSRAYKSAKSDLPPPAMDDAIRAAARRAVKSQPQAIGKSWISRYTVPLSAAALVVLTMSVGFIALDERPELAPASLKEVASPKSATAPAAPAPPTPAPAPAPDNSAPVAVIASDLPQSARTAEKKARLDLQSVAPRDQMAASAKAHLAQRRNEADGAASGNLLAKDADLGVASPAVTPFVPAPPPAEVVKRQESASQSAAETTKREAPQVKQLLPQAASAAVAARGDAGSLASQKTVAAAPLTLADKANEPPDVWMKRILELKQQGRVREFEEEFAKFRKRYPDYLLPEELKAQK